MGGPERTDQIIARVASGHRGVLTRPWLLDAGVTDKQIEIRCARGSLIAEYPGVYRVGHQGWCLEATYLAAVLACGDGARLGGFAGAHLYVLIRGEPPKPEVLTLGDRDIDGIDTRRLRRRPDAWPYRTYRDVPVLTVPALLIDLAPRATENQLVDLCHQADVLFGVTPDRVEAVLANLPRTPGTARLREVLHGGIPITLSELERRFLALLERRGLPRPTTNKRVGRYRIDCRWAGHRVTIELDSYRFHRSRKAWEQAYSRERQAYARGDAFRRYTWRDVVEDQTAMLSELRPLLLGG